MGLTLYIIFGSYALISCLIVFVLFFADVNSQGIYGGSFFSLFIPSFFNIFVVISRFLIEKIPNFLTLSIKSIFGERGYQFIYGIYDYIVNQRNPLLQVSSFLIERFIV